MSPSSRRARPSAQRLRSIVASAPILILRRVRRDVSLLTGWTLTVAFAILLAVIGPAHLVRILDEGARDAVRAAGTDSDLVVETAVADVGSVFLQVTVPPAEVSDLAGEVESRLPDALRRSRSATTVAVTGQRVAIADDQVQPALTDPNVTVRMRLAMLTEDNSRALSMIAGALPRESTAQPGDPVELIVSAATAEATSLVVGSVISLEASDSAISTSGLTAEVVGIVDERRVGPVRLSPWRDVSEVWDPVVTADGSSNNIGITVLASPGDVARLIEIRGNAFSAIFRYSFDADTFTADRLATATEETRQIIANSGLLVGGSGYEFEVGSGFADAVADFPDRARASLAEISIIVAGTVGVGALVLLLVSRLIVYRRLPDVLLERARGASLIAIALRTTADAALTLVIATLVASGVAGLAGLGRIADAWPAVLVGAVALLAGPVQTVVAVQGRFSAAAVGVNRRDAVRRLSRRRAARATAEGAVVLLAAASLVALLDRGLLQTDSDGIDPLVASAPLLSAAAVTLVVLRVSRWPVRVAAAAANRARGIVGPVISSRVLRAVPVAPVTALTIAIGIVIVSGLVGQTVADGQVEASWQRVGADARIDARLDGEEVRRITGASGVSRASALNVQNGLQLDLETSRTGVTLLSVDRGYPQLVADLPDIEGVTDADDADVFARLTEPVPDDAPLPVIVDAAVAERLISKDVSIAIGETDVQLTVIGTVDSGPVGYLDDPLVYLDLPSLSARLPVRLAVNSLLAIGPGSAAAVNRLDLPAPDVLTRSGWLGDRRDLALISGVQQSIVGGAIALGVLALVAVVCNALAGSPDRGRYLALLRTLGVRSRFGILLAVIDQVPPMLASIVGGMLSGLGIAVVLTPALGLEFLTGGLYSPEPAISAPIVLAVPIAAVLVFAIGTLTEVFVRRRDRLSDTIRVGEAL